MNHILYVDDLKLISEDSEEMKKDHDIVMRWYKATGFEVNINKSAVMKSGRIKIPENMKDLPVTNITNKYK